ncbi:hypothetical protein D3C79_797940 [compost metagenome]
MLGEVVGHAADGIDRIGEQIPLAIPVKIDRVVAVAGGHELAHTHGARIGAFEAGERPLLLPGEQHQLGELLGEEIAALRVVKTQGIEAVEHGVTAHLAAIEGLDTDDGDDKGGRHSIGLLGPRQRLCVALPECDTVPDPLGGDEQRPVAVPGFGLPGAGYGVEDLLAQLRLSGGRLQLGKGHRVLQGELRQLGRLGGCNRRQGAERQRTESEPPQPTHQASNRL